MGRRLKPFYFWLFFALLLQLYIEQGFILRRWDVATVICIVIVGYTYAHFGLSDGRWK